MTRRILLIDDEPISLDIIRALLVGQGYSVDVATDGFGALDRARSVAYDVALVDYHLPEMDGYALGRLLGEQHAGPGGPVLIGLTADRNGLAARRGADAVFRAILPKPIKPAELFETIERLCEQARVPAPGPASLPEPTGPEVARLASAALWREYGLAHHPRAFVCPPPTTDQAAALGLCFDLVGPDAAEVVVLLERHGVNEATGIARRGAAERRPIVGLSADHADLCDLLFTVDDAASWLALAVRLGGRKAAPVPLATSVVEIQTAPAPVIAFRPIASEPATPADNDTPPLGPDLREIVLSGVCAPLTLLRDSIEKGLRQPASVDSGFLADVLTRLDQALLVSGALADFLNRPSRAEPQTGLFDPAELARNAVAMMRDAMEPGGPALACRIDARVPRKLHGDVHRLSQIILTLLDDACSHHAGGMLTLQLSFAEGGLSFALDHAPAADDDEIGWKRPDAAVIAQLRSLRMATLSRLVSMIGGRLDVVDGVPQRLDVPATPEIDATAFAGPDPLDAGVREKLLSALGEASVERLTGQLLAQLAELAAGAGTAGDAARLAELSGCAAVLGLTELAGRCEAFAQTAGPAIDARLQVLGAAVARAEQALGPMRRAAA